ncbi:TatD family hydrolase [Thalassotalea fusca]
MHYQFTDTHCHLDFDSFSDTLASLLKQCGQLGISRIIVPSIGPENWHKVLKLSHHPSTVKLQACLGIHPWFLSTVDNNTLEQLQQLALAKQTDIIAIGETGIDGKIAEQQNNLSLQIEVFESQIQLANQIDKPLIVHHRQSHQILHKTLSRIKCQRGGIIHAFSGSYQQAKSYIDLGFKLGIGGTITYPRAQKTLKTVSKLPLSSLVLETDAPSMPLFGQQGKDNSPVNIPTIFAQLCTLRSESPDTVAEQLQTNVSELFDY